MHLCPHRLGQGPELVERCGEEDPVHAFAVGVRIGSNAVGGCPGVIRSAIAVDQDEGVDWSAPSTTSMMSVREARSAPEKVTAKPDMMPPRRLR